MGIESRPGPLPAPAEHPAHTGVRSRLRGLRHLTWAAVVGAVVAAAVYNEYTGANQQKTGEVAENVRDFEALPDGEILLDLHRDGFVSQPVRLPSTEQGKPGPVVTFMAPAGGERHKGPLVRVNGVTYSITDPDPLDSKKRVSLHLSRIIRHDGGTIRIESDTPLFKGTHALVPVGELARECASLDLGCRMVCVQCDTRGKFTFDSKSVALSLEAESPKLFVSAASSSELRPVTRAETERP